MKSSKCFTIILTLQDGYVEKYENLDIEQFIGEVYLILYKLIEERLNIKEVKIEIENS